MVCKVVLFSLCWALLGVLCGAQQIHNIFLDSWQNGWSLMPVTCISQSSNQYYYQGNAGWLFFCVGNNMYTFRMEAPTGGVPTTGYTFLEFYINNRGSLSLEFGVNATITPSGNNTATNVTLSPPHYMDNEVNSTFLLVRVSLADLKAENANLTMLTIYNINRGSPSFAIDYVRLLSEATSATPSGYAVPPTPTSLPTTSQATSSTSFPGITTSSPSSGNNKGGGGSSNGGGIAAGVIIAVLVVAGAVIGFIVYRKKQKSEMYKSPSQKTLNGSGSGSELSSASSYSTPSSHSSHATPPPSAHPTPGHTPTPSSAALPPPLPPKKPEPGSAVLSNGYESDSPGTTRSAGTGPASGTGTTSSRNGGTGAIGGGTAAIAAGTEVGTGTDSEYGTVRGPATETDDTGSEYDTMQRIATTRDEKEKRMKGLALTSLFNVPSFLSLNSTDSTSPMTSQQPSPMPSREPSLLDFGEVSPIVRDTIAYLSEKGLKEEGILRLAGSSAETNRLKAAYERGETVDFDSCTDINSVADLLKRHLRELPEPLIPHTYLSNFQDAMGYEGDERINLLRKALRESTLPVAKKQTMKMLFLFLFQVVQHSSFNKMSSSNLALVFAPTLRMPPDLLDAFIKYGNLLFNDL